MSQNKPIFFYSNYCVYSNELLKQLQKHNIIDNFTLINVSNSKYKIPSIITSVPSVYFQNKVLKDSELESFLEQKTANTETEIDAFFPSEMNSGIGYSYSYIGDGNNDEDSTNIKNSLMYIGDMNTVSINTPEENDFQNSGKASLEKLQADRDQDIKKILDPNGQSLERTLIR